MKIPQKLSQFEREKALIIVSGKQRGEFYFAHKGRTEKAGSFKFSQPKYSDREGHFMQRGRAGVYKTGAVYESKKDWIRIELRRRLRENVKRLMAEKNPDSLYLVTPEHLKNLIRDALPARARKRIKMHLSGNYSRFHPTDILKKIGDARRPRRRPPVSYRESAAKIMRKTEKARKITGGRLKR